MYSRGHAIWVGVIDPPDNTGLSQGAKIELLRCATTRHDVRVRLLTSKRSRVALLVALGLLVLATLGVGTIALFVSSDVFLGGKLTTHTSSREFATPEERVAFLARYLKLHSPVSDAAFSIDYMDNGFAPSDWDIRAAMRVLPASVPAWLEDAHPLDEEFAYRRIVPETWVHEEPVLYRRQTTRIAVFPAGGVIVVHSTTMGNGH
jgi:hypothetical protein